MPSVDFLTEIRNRLPARQAQALVSRLRVDPLVWASLHEEAFLETALAKMGENLADWSPAGLARLAVGDGWEDAQKWSLKPAELKRAHQIFSEAVRDHRVAVSLKEAAYLAVALLERWQQTDNLMNLIEVNAGEPEGRLLAIWRTPLACVFGMITDPARLLRALLPKKPGILSMAWISHCILSNPIESMVQVQLLTNILAGISPAQQMNWMRYLQLSGNTELVSQVARSLLTKTPPSTTSSLASHAPERFDLELNVVRLVELMRMVSLYRYSGQPANARAMAQKANQTLAHLNARLVLQAADIDLSDGQMNEAVIQLKKVVNTVSNNSVLPAEAVMAVSGCEAVYGVLESIPAELTTPVLSIYRAKLQYDQGNLEKGRETAISASRQLLDLVSHQPVGMLAHYLGDWHPEGLIQCLAEMNLPSEALACAEKILETRPSDLALLETAGEIAFNQQLFARALEFATTVQLLQPDDPSRHRQTARILEKMSQWNQAKIERALVLEMDGGQIPDWIALGRCSLHLSQWDEVLSASERVLEREPENGKACALKGQALIALGRQDEAVKLLNQATLLAPEEAEPWLALAKMQGETGDNQRSIETMKAAVLAVPDSAEINFALGQAFIRGGLFSDGLPYLRKAAELAPESVEVTLDLGRALVALGHHDEARKVLTQGRQRWPRHAALAHAFAEVALIYKEREEALSALDVALQGEEAPFDWFILAAQCLTSYDSDGTRPEPDVRRLIAVQLGLEKGIRADPERIEAQVLRAEILLARQEYAQAYVDLQAIIESCTDLNGLKWRLQAGLGEAALKLGRIEQALVALKEAVLSQPENPRLYRLLAETYQAGQFNPEAVQTAQEALKLMPDGLSMLEWYAGFMVQMGQLQEAYQALKTATQLAPDGVVYWISLAEIQFQQGDFSAVETSLETALALKRLTLTHLRQICGVYLALGKPEAALTSLQRADSSEIAVDQEWWVEKAYLHQVNRQYEPAYTALQKAIQNLPGMTWLSVFKADLLMKLGRLDGARACLEQAQQYYDTRQARPAVQLLKSRLIPVAWQVAMQEANAVAMRFAQLERRAGHLTSALRYAEEALAVQPGRAELHNLAVDLACALLLTPRAAQLADLPILRQSPVPVDERNSPEALAGLLCRQAELALEGGDLDAALEKIQKADELQVNLPRILAIKARLQARTGDWQKAMAFYRQLSQQISEDSAQNSGFSADDEPAPLEFWQVQTALEMMDWAAALDKAQSLVDAYPAEPQVLMGLIQAMVKCAESGILCKDALVTAHAPKGDCLNPKMQQEFETWVSALENATNPILVERWRARGRAAFNPSSQNLRLLADLLPAEEEAAALMAHLRANNNLSAAIHIAQDYPNSVPVLFQLAFCHLTVDPGQGLKAANRAAEIDASHPIVLAALALTLERNGFLGEALDIWENALSIWEDEPLWQAKAANLAGEIGDLPSAVAHWETASALVPENLDFTAELSKVYLEDEQAEKAAELLEQATALDSSRADLWYLLAQARRHANQLQQALACAEKACALDAAAVQPVLLCGEIALQMGNPDLAMEFAHKALNSQPANEAAVLFQVKVHEWSDQPEEGLNLLEKSITPDSSVTMVLSYARLVYKQRGAQAALPMLKKIAETDPDEVGVLNLLAHAQEECGELTNAEKTAFQALQLQPSQPDLNLLMGRLKRQEGQLDQSVHYLSEAIRQEPEVIDAYLELGKTYLDRREMVQALHVYEKAIKADPSDHRPYYQAGIVLRESKDYVGAENMLKRAAELAPGDVNIRRLLGAVMTLNLIHNSQEVGTVNELQ